MIYSYGAVTQCHLEVLQLYTFQNDLMSMASMPAMHTCLLNLCVRAAQHAKLFYERLQTFSVSVQTSMTGLMENHCKKGHRRDTD